jgi:putative restriction endonuclease
MTVAKKRNWLDVLVNLRIDRSKGSAPHKPLLLLLLLEMIEKSEVPGNTLLLTPELAFRFSTYWSIVAHRRSQPPDVRLPFHHLHSDGVWQPFMKNGERSPDHKVTSFVELDAGFDEFLRERESREQARRLLIARYFEPGERNAFYALLEMDVPSEDELARDASYQSSQDSQTQGREARFRLDIVAAYKYTCALTGYRVTTINGATIVDAAHIHQFANSRNNDPRNGLALCKNAHWLFDNGLWSLDDDYQVIIAAEAFDEASPNQMPLVEYQGKRILLPNDRSTWPDPRHVAWHRKRKFKAA